MEIKRQTYRIEGMTCSGCEKTVSRVIANIEGVQAAKADLASGTVTVEYDPSIVTIDKMKTAVTNVGYKFTAE